MNNWVEQRVFIKFCVSYNIPYLELSKKLIAIYGDSALPENHVYQWYVAFISGYKNVNKLPCARASTGVVMDNVTEQRHYIKFCVKHGSSFENTVDMLVNTYGDSTIYKGHVCEWYGAFQRGHNDINDLPSSKISREAVIEQLIVKVKDLLFENSEITLKEISLETGFPQQAINKIVNDVLQKKRVADSFVPINLNSVYKKHRKRISKYMFYIATRDATFMKEIITGGETWFFEYDERTGRRIFQVMLIVFFDCRGVVHFEYLPQDHIVDDEYYLGVIKRLRISICQKRPDLWANNSWLLHHDNAPYYKSLVVSDYLDKHSISLIQQALYSPDLSPCNYFLFPFLKLSLQSIHCKLVKIFEQRVSERLMAIPTTDYQKCMSDLVDRWYQCLLKDGDYIPNYQMNDD